MVSKNELRQNTAAVLARVSESEDVIVTERGAPRWRIGRVPSRPVDALARLAADGGYSPPSATPTAWAIDPPGHAYTSDEVDELLADTRGDR